jgi:hypothetical protein
MKDILVLRSLLLGLILCSCEIAQVLMTLKELYMALEAMIALR